MASSCLVRTESLRLFLGILSLWLSVIRVEWNLAIKSCTCYEPPISVPKGSLWSGRESLIYWISEAFVRIVLSMRLMRPTKRIFCLRTSMRCLFSSAFFCSSFCAFCYYRRISCTSSVISIDSWEASALARLFFIKCSIMSPIFSIKKGTDHLKRSIPCGK